MLLIYTGHGKGKTSACVGQAVRAMGQGLTVAFGQFMKRDGQAGEQRMLAQWLGERFLAGGQGFLRREEERPAHRAAALRVLAWAREQLEAADMLILDEAIYALGAGILERKEVEGLLAEARAQNRHLVLSGRNAPDWLIRAADLVTEMGEIKHPWRAGVKAVRGIEF
ncbi:cob(I)yrinic acid a,c-diamide adenosyltransferase [Desulfovibrio sp. ZJ369]|uniref:cob(I)yrinic acid a,c-diamide adenosyltransferase n=1 Tax=Desulfovibrio sp. ZJ369 TaxID=2709793 RepID=UPI0013EBBCAB|nr:cob(I)yrinic acid a,c-diamide adenosyltransferase [Desulfovibrio sp. ZJ369]